MDEFNNRIAAQRYILKLVNSTMRDEELYGLSAKAIERWIISNRLDHKSTLIGLVKQVADKLFFLANKSQEQISEEYQLISHEIHYISERIATEMSRSA
jgi:hypothetical protein